MESIISYFAVTPTEFWVGVLLIVVAVMVLLAALRPEREYRDLPRGVFPDDGKLHPTRRASSSEPPLRTALPEMSPAEAALIIREADGPSLTIVTLVDLAARGFLEFTEYRQFPGAPPSVVVVFLKEADSTCTSEERYLLEILADQGAAESNAFVLRHPFDLPRYRNTLESLGVPPLGLPTARLSGLRSSVSDTMAEIVSHRLEVEREWFRTARQKLSNAGALEFLGGAMGAAVSIFLMLTSSLRPFWLLVCGVLVLLGAITILGAAERTVEGSVARDQVLGFRRYLLEAPRAGGATLEQFAHLAGWAVALDCAHEWEQSIERLSVGDNRRVDEVFPWIVYTTSPLTELRQIPEFIKLMFARIHSAPEADDTRDDDTLGAGLRGWQSSPSTEQ